jgi:hypothetical protein
MSRGGKGQLAGKAHQATIGDESSHRFALLPVAIWPTAQARVHFDTGLLHPGYSSYAK